MTLEMQGDQRAGEQERAGEGDGKAETGDRTEAERSRGDQHHDARLDLILSGISRPLINDSILLSGDFEGERRDKPGVQASACREGKEAGEGENTMLIT